MPSTPTRRRRRLHLPYDHGAPIAQADYSVITAIALLALAICWWPGWTPATHAIVLDVPTSSGLGRAFEPWPNDVPHRTLTISEAGFILWDGVPINGSALAARIEATINTNPRPGIVFAPEPTASYDLVARVMNMLVMRGATDNRFCLAGLSRYRTFGSGREGLRLATTI